jgi:hypothetical protein
MTICKQLNCKTQACFNKVNETKGIFCGKHKETGMENVKEKRRCKFPDCKSLNPRFNKPSEIKGIFCGKHKETGMENVKEKRRCQFSECNSQKPAFNKSGQKKGILCSKHKEPGMEDVRSKKCQFSDCKSLNPAFNLPGESKGIYCGRHKEMDMEDIKNKRCQFQDCKSISPTFNKVGKKIGIFCGTHKEPDMENVRSKKCQYIGCNIQPSYNTSGEKKGIYCFDHKEPYMINVIDKKCQFLNCDIIPCFNNPNKLKGIFCYSHKKPNMVNVKNKKCIECDEVQVCNLQYKGHCLRCFIFKFPENKVSRNYKIKEQHMVDFIKETYSDITFMFDKTTGACSKRRPDAYLDLLTHVLIIECDENQHRSYTTSCENSRTMELFQDFNNRPIVFIRFNPDTYSKDGKRIISSFKIHKKNGVPIIRNKDEWNGRLDLLKTTIDKHLQTIPEKEVNIENLFFNN